MNKESVLKFFSAENEAQAKRHLYKYTDCGAWIGFEDWGIVIGSIVEGCDFGTATYPLRYANNFSCADIQARIDAVEKEAKDIWEWVHVHGAEGDAPDTSYEFGNFEQGDRSD